MMLVNMCNLGFEHCKACNVYDGIGGDWHLKYMLELGVFDVNKILKTASWYRNM